MSIVINTNMGAMYAQNAMNKATWSLNTSLQRLSSGQRINSAKDDPAGAYVASQLNSQINGTVSAYNNVQIGYNMIQTVSGDLANINDQLERIKDLATQFSNDTLTQEQQQAIKDEAQQRVDEINRIAKDSKFNKLQLLDGTKAGGVRLQIGAGSDPETNALYVKGVFEDATTEGLELVGGSSTYADIEAAFADASTAAAFIDVVDKSISTVTKRQSDAGVYNARLESVLNSIAVKNENLSSAYSTVMDADIAVETSNYIKQQLLQQTASSMVAQANQMQATMVLKFINMLGG